LRIAQHLEALDEACRHLEYAGDRVLDALAAQSGKVDHVHRNAVARHDVALHAVRGAQPRDFPAQLTHGLRDCDAGEDVAARAGRHDHQPFHWRPPRMRTRFS
jgi:hypothetical protein